MKITETRTSSKRARLNDSSCNHQVCLKIAKKICKKDLHRERSEKIEDRELRATFGCELNIAVLLWKMLNEYNLVPEGGSIHHLIWAFMFMKIYGKETTMKSLAGGYDAKTIVKLNCKFIESIADLSPILVSNLTISHI